MSSARLKQAAALSPLLLSFAVPSHAQQLMDPIVATATRQETKASELLSDVTVIDRREIDKHAGETIADVLAAQPGIQFSRNGGPGTATSLYVRGANPEQTKVLVDGVPINSLDASGSALRFISLDSVERIEIVRGPASSLYGADAIGGVIQIFTRKGGPGVKFNSFAGYGTHNTLQANAGLSVGEEKWNFRFEGNRMSTSGISAQSNASNQDADRDGYFNTGGAASFTLRPVDGHELGVSYRENQGRVFFDSGNVPADGNFDDHTDFRTSQWRIYSKDRLTSFWNSTLQYGQSTDWQKTFQAYAPQGTFLETENRDLTWQNDVDLPLGKLLVAYEYQAQQAGADATQPFTAGDNMETNSVLLGWTANWGRSRWQINGRRDINSVFGSKNTYSAAYGYQLTSEWRAQASYGTSFKAPSLYQLYTPIYGNPSLKPENARNREVGLVWEHDDQTASVTYYRNSVQNLINWVLTDPTTFNGQYENVKKATLQGVTLNYTGRFGDWRLHGSYDWLQAIDDSTGMMLGRRARNKLVAGASHIWGPVEAGAELVNVSSRFNTDKQTGRLGGYSLVNLTARYAVSKSLSIEGRIDNVFDKKYELAQGFNTMGITAFVGVRYVMQ